MAYYGMAGESKRRSYFKVIPVVLLLGVLGFIFFVRLKPTDVPVESVAQAAALPKPPDRNTQAVLRAGIKDPRIATESAVLVDVDSGTLLYSDRGQITIPIASTTKLMSVLIIRQHLDLDQIVTVSSEDASVIGSTMALRSGDQLTVRQLLDGMLMVSGNDAGWALARTVAGSNSQFAELMNAEAKKLGLTHTKFKDPVGLDDTGYSTAFELSILARAVLNDPVLASIVDAPSADFTSISGKHAFHLKNSNHLITDLPYQGILGLKTGYTPDAGHCLVAAAARDGHRLVAVIMHTNAETITASAIEARKLLDWGWTATDWKIATS